MTTTAVSQKGGSRLKPLLLVSLLPLLICIITMCIVRRRPVTVYSASVTPQFDALVTVDSLANARKIKVGVKQFTVMRIIKIPSESYCHYTVITQDGTHFVAVGTITDILRPGLVFRARMLPYPERRRKNVIWLEESSPDAVTDPTQLDFSDGIHLP